MNPLCIWSRNQTFFIFPMLFDLPKTFGTKRENHRKEPAFRLPSGQGQGEKQPNAQRVNMNSKTNKIQTTHL